jgi:hypothetical protein
MTSEEHKLIVLMFARVNEALGMISDTLKSRELWTGDDQRAFPHAVHADDSKLVRFVLDATRDYQRLASQLGVVTGLEDRLPPSPNSR